ncbi:hypothetical protein [Bdellovibrio bacteriovorus]|uniref:hypothetical protein n=1 Tax=Bdellovibrio TaxID=958 RepID=UPI0035A997F2
MKKELLASVLTLTAGMASTVTFPQTALAKSTVIEREFSQVFRLKSADKVRHTTENGQVVLGHIYLNLEQSPSAPEYNNQLRGEMTGSFYFESDDYTSEYEGRQFKTIVTLTGDDGEVLLDLTHRSKNMGNKYQVYGCNSTRTMCSADSYELSISPGKQVEMQIKFAASLKLEMLRTYNDHSEWVTDVYSAPMVEVTVE